MLNANFFSIELWYRGKLQFVREVGAFKQVAKFRADWGYLDTDNRSDATVKVYHHLASTEKTLLDVGKYPHKSDFLMNGHQTSGFDAMKRLIMSL